MVGKLLSESIFGPGEVLLENLHFHLHTFSGQGTSQSPKLIPKAVFFIKSYILLKLKKTELLGQYKKKRKQN